MKSFFKITILVVSFITCSVVFAAKENPTPEPRLMFKTIYSDTFVLFVTAYDNEIKVNLHDDSGVLLFSENLKKGYVYRKTYDISGLSDGTYYAEVIENKEVKLFCVTKGKNNTISEIEKLPFK